MADDRTGMPISEDDFDKMTLEALTLALIRLTCWKEGKGELSYLRAWKGYDFDVLNSLQDQGFITFRKSNKSLELTDDGFFFGNVFAARFGMSLAEALAHSPEFAGAAAGGGEPHDDGEDRPVVLSGGAETPAAGMCGDAGDERGFPGFSIVDGGREEPVSNAGAFGAHADALPPDAFFPTAMPLEARPRFDPAENRRENDRRAFRLRIELDLEGLHPCWREIEIPATCTFLDLHVAIQRIFNWYDEHLFSFHTKARGRKLHIEEAAFIDPSCEVFAEPDVAVVEASRIQLGDVFPRTRTARYEYDYGDGWEHRVKVVKTIANSTLTAPRLADGNGDAPPEDVGGIGGFEHFLMVMADPEHPEHRDLFAWAMSQMAEPFDLAMKQADLEECWLGDRALWLDSILESARRP